MQGALREGSFLARGTRLHAGVGCSTGEGQMPGFGGPRNKRLRFR